MNLTDMYIKIFGRTEFLNINMGFWIAIGICTLIVIAMNVIFWGMKPKASKVLGEKGHEN